MSRHQAQAVQLEMLAREVKDGGCSCGARGVALVLITPETPVGPVQLIPTGGTRAVYLMIDNHYNKSREL